MEPQSPFDSLSKERIVASEQPAEPKLGIVHLLGWTVCTAFSLGFYLSTLRRHGAYFPISASTALSCFHLVLLALCWGAAFGALLILVSRRWRGVPFPRHPGEFLAILVGVACLADLVYFATDLMMLQRSPKFDSTGYLLVAFSTPQLLITALLVVWATRSVRERRWQIFFLTLLVRDFIVFGIVLLVWRRAPLNGELMMKLALFTVWLWIPLALLLAISLWRDRCLGCRRPWTHWLGVVLQVWYWVL